MIIHLPLIFFLVVVGFGFRFQSYEAFFVFNWPGGQCIQIASGAECDPQKLKLWDNQSFTIQGLRTIKMATKSYGQFDFSVIQQDPSLLDDMNNYWPSMSGSETTLWKSEWEKYGWDYADIILYLQPNRFAELSGEQLNRKLQYAYFHDAIMFYKSFPGVIRYPQKSVTKESFANVLKIQSNHSIFSCALANLINEIRVCFDITPSKNIVKGCFFPANWGCQKGDILQLPAHKKNTQNKATSTTDNLTDITNSDDNTKSQTPNNSTDITNSENSTNSQTPDKNNSTNITNSDNNTNSKTPDKNNLTNSSSFSQSFDGFFVFSWFGGHCLHISKSGGCSRSIIELWDNQSFTIHGLWPNSTAENQQKFNLSVIKNDSALLDDMNNYWPPKSRENQSQAFLWEHQWNKHGWDYAKILLLLQPNRFANLSGEQLNRKLQYAYFHDAIMFYKSHPGAIRYPKKNVTKDQFALRFGIQANQFTFSCVRANLIRQVKVCLNITSSGNLVKECAKQNNTGCTKTDIFELPGWNDTKQVPEIAIAQANTDL